MSSQNCIRNIKLACPSDNFLVGGQVAYSEYIDSMTELKCRKDVDNAETITITPKVQGGASGETTTSLASCGNGYDKVSFWEDDTGVTGLQFYCEGRGSEFTIGRRVGQERTFSCPTGDKIESFNVEYELTRCEDKSGIWKKVNNVECVTPSGNINKATVTTSGDNTAGIIWTIVIVIIVIIILCIALWAFTRSPKPTPPTSVQKPPLPAPQPPPGAPIVPPGPPSEPGVPTPFVIQ